MMRLLLFILLIVCFACSRTEQKKIEQNPTQPNEVRYAKGFEIKQYVDYTAVYIKEKNSNSRFGKLYWLASKLPSQPRPDSVTFIQIPIQKIVCSSTTHIPHLVYLNETNALVGFPTPDYISSEQVRKRINQGLVVDVGQEADVNIEKIIALQPHVMMTYTMQEEANSYRLLNQFKIPVIFNTDFLEQHPLGRAEWIKLTGILFDKKAKADSIFSAIENQYLQLKNLTDSVSYQPTVFSGVLYGDSWFLPGGQNYAAILFQDAGMDYVWKDDASTSFLQLPFETVLTKAGTADFWIGTASFTDFSSLKNADKRYPLFKAFQLKNVFHYNVKLGEKGGSFYLEEGYLRPDFILADLIKIAHPDKIPNHNFHYHAPLGE